MRKTLVSAALLGALSTHAAVLDFDYTSQAITTSDSLGLGEIRPISSPGTYYSQTYGDVVGLVDVTYSYFAPGSNTSSQTLQTYSTGYDDLVYVAWWGAPAANDRAQVRLASVNGSEVTLDSFDLGIWSSGRGVPETVTVYEIGQPTPVFTQQFSENNQHHTFSLGLKSTSGFVIEWTSPWWVAIDNISSSAAPIPEPGSWALMLAGAFAVGPAIRRR